MSVNVEIGTEAAQFPEKKYINGIFVAVWGPQTLELYSGVVHLFTFSLSLYLGSFWREIKLNLYNFGGASNILLSDININIIMKKLSLHKLIHFCVHSFLVLVKISNWKLPGPIVQ